MSIKKFSKGEAIRFGWHTAKTNLGFFIGLLIIMTLFFAVPAFIAEAILKINVIAGNILYIINYALVILISMGLVKITLRFCDNEQGRLADLFSQYHLFFKYLFGGFLYGLIIFSGMALIIIPINIGITLLNLDIQLFTAIGLILSIIPGIILGIQFWFFDYFIIDKGLGPIEALKRSSAITKGIKWNLFVFFLMLIGINMLGALLIMLMSIISLFITIPVITAIAAIFGILFFLIILFITIPTTILASAFVYRKLLAQTEIAPVPGALTEDINTPQPTVA